MIGAVLAGVAVIAIGGQPAQVEAGAAWREVEARSVEDGPSLVMRTEDGGLMAVTIAMTPNPDAWRTSRREAYQAAIVDGFEAAPGVTVKRAKKSMVKGVPCLDLALVRDGKPVAVRLLLFRTRTIAAAVEGVDAATAAAAARGLVPTRDAR